MGMDIVSGDGGGRQGGDEEALSPFDLLLMRGSCVVNEAMLTGESVPQAKTSLLSAGGSGDAWVKVEDGTDSPLRKHIIFSGTKVWSSDTCVVVLRRTYSDVQHDKYGVINVCFFFSSRRRHTRSCLVSWARRCV